MYNVASDFVNNIEIQSAEPKLLAVFFWLVVGWHKNRGK